MALPNTIPKLKVLDCNDVATSLPVSTCLVTAVWKIVTRAPKDIPQSKSNMGDDEHSLKADEHKHAYQS
ncbi:MAG TPA: hypothetical protein GX396_10660 [Tissierellia bacterium]|nr:hypothetical protein [Tissierellia bacterium]